MLHDLNTYLHKAIPDTKLTIRKYLDVKFEYLVRWQRFEWVQFHCDDFHCAEAALFCVTQQTPCVFQSYCLKVKEMDDEEYSSIVS